MQRLLELIFPPKCILCRRILAKEELDLCRRCRTDAPEFSGHRKKLRYVSDYTAAWFYEDQVRESIIRYKFRNVRSYADGYGRMTAMAVLQDLPGDLEIVTWVPVSARRKQDRGYDQVELIARVVSGELGLPCEKLLTRIRDNKPNSSLDSAEERRANVLGAYRAEQAEKVCGRKILLLDDIITTGATASECARMLLSAGAKEVYAAAVAAGRNQK